ncbi:MAG: 2-amino-4-hydroxy-6-hydroxymethyldihydropteridine diphosphokinase [Chloroflexi bacterium]|nr:2-amino-4-hydroxy-6-hydroxymethyldihydropteridine diphosphokinase [Chloroflexota bacterium]
MLAEAYLGLGSNLGDRAANISQGLDMLRAASKHVVASGLYESSAAGFEDQPRFLNAACRVWTLLDPFELMAEIHRVQTTVSGNRPFLNGPRTLDIDVLLHGGTVLDIPGLTVPHPRMMMREFVLTPLAEIAPGLAHPLTGETVGSALRRLSTGSMRWMGRAAVSPSYRIVPYDPAWPIAFEEERRLIVSMGLVDEGRVVHIGSTSVPGLGAKPTVDIMLGVPFGETCHDLVDGLERIGYEHRGESAPGIAYLRKTDPRRYNLHLCEYGGEFWVDQLLFQDHLRAHTEVAVEYERVKRDVMSRYAHSPSSYNDGKAGFIRSVLEKAR